MSLQFQQKPKQSQAKNNDAKPGKQNQDIFQMRWEANLIMQKQQEEEDKKGEKYVLFKKNKNEIGRYW